MKPELISKKLRVGVNDVYNAVKRYKEGLKKVYEK